MKTTRTRVRASNRVLVALLVLLQPALAASGDNLESGRGPLPGQAKDTTDSAEELSARWEAVVDCLLGGDSDCVLEYLDQIIEQDPETWEAYALRAQIREEAGDRVGAESDRRTLAGVGGAYAAIEEGLTTAIDRDPTNPDPVWQRAIHRWQAGNDVEGALTDLDLVVELSSGIASQRVHMMRAKLLEIQGDYEGAIQDYSTVIGLKSGIEATALTERARLLGLLGRTEVAKQDIEILAEFDRARRDDLIMTTSRRIEAHPKDIMSLYLRGMEYLHRDDFAAALSDAEAIISSDPNNWLGYSLRSGVRRRTGDLLGYRDDRAMVKELSGQQD